MTKTVRFLKVLGSIAFAVLIMPVFLFIPAALIFLILGQVVKHCLTSSGCSPISFLDVLVSIAMPAIVVTVLLLWHWRRNDFRREAKKSIKEITSSRLLSMPGAYSCMNYLLEAAGSDSWLAASDAIFLENALCF